MTAPDFAHATIAVLTDSEGLARWEALVRESCGPTARVVAGPSPEAELLVDPSHPQGVAIHLDGWSDAPEPGDSPQVAPPVVTVPDEPAVLRGALPVALAFARRASVPFVGASLRALVEQLPVDVWVRDAENTCVYANAAARKIWPGIVGRRPAEQDIDSRVEAIWMENNRRALGGEVVRGEVAYDHTRPDGRYVNVLAPIVHRGSVVGTVGVNIDVSEQHHLRSRLARAEQLALMGTLAAGVGHEIKNPVSFAALNLEMALRSLDSMASGAAAGEASTLEAMGTLLRTAREGVLRVGALATELQSLGRPAKSTADERADLNDVVAAALRLAGPELRQRGRVEAVYSDVPPVRANAGRLGQVVLNLLMNAASALAARHDGSGSLRVETGQVGGRARVTVADDGPGVPAALRGRLFSAFARGREGEDSTGLGLYVSKHIVEEYGGTIRLDDGPHGGTVAIVELPLAPTA